MTGIDRLRTLAGAWDEWGLGGALMDVADQIERERACDADTIENVRLILGGVVDEMESHCLGHEGMEDSPVARWARELRAALGGDEHDPTEDVSMSAYDLLPQEDREAAAWIRKHGGLDAVKRRWECLSYYADPVPRSCMEKRLARLQRQIDESHAALRRRREVISELNRRACDLTRESAELRRRAMPEGMEWLLEAWPMFEDGEPVRFLDDFERYGDENGVSIVTMYQDGSFALNCRAYSKGERVNHPAPKVLDADGVEIRVGDTLWHVETGEQCKVVGVDSRSVSVDYRVDGDGTKHTGSVLPSKLTHRAPVLAADGRPLSAGETVWNVKTGERYVVGAFAGGCVNVSDGRGGGLQLLPSQLTHERPIADTWERLERDAKAAVCVYFGVSDRDCGSCGHSSWECSYDKASDLVRRARALSERERSE